MAIYQKFYVLREAPFNVTSDPSFLYFSRHHKEAFSHFLYGIKERKGFLQLTGEIGSGKTTLCRAILDSLDEKTKTAFIMNPNLSAMQLLKSIVGDFGIQTKARNRMDLMDALNQFLIGQLAERNNVVLIIDEAQNLTLPVLEQVRMLSNLETRKEKLLQIALVGQPELRNKLDDPLLLQLRQRIGVRYHISPLDEDEVEQYIYHRLHVAGSNGSIHFSPKAVDLIYRYSKGTPRLINMACDKCLLAGFVYETYEIAPEMARRCIQELENLTAHEPH
ncbi:MAG: AAA family ATPase [Candidatus Omnitrophota bacterium]